MRLANKVAIITGTASGMGLATAKLFAQEGAQVVVADLLKAEGGEVTANIVASGGQAMFVALDVTSESAWEQAISQTLASYGAIHVLVNNAGVSGSDPDFFSLDCWDQQLDVNARSMFLRMRVVVPCMRQAGSGSIVNISSMSGGLVGQTMVHMGYNASKGPYGWQLKPLPCSWRERIFA